jgi:hypothetical protein
MISGLKPSPLLPILDELAGFGALFTGGGGNGSNDFSAAVLKNYENGLAVVCQQKFPVLA